MNAIDHIHDVSEKFKVMNETNQRWEEKITLRLNLILMMAGYLRGQSIKSINIL